MAQNGISSSSAFCFPRLFLFFRPVLFTDRGLRRYSLLAGCLGSHQGYGAQSIGEPVQLGVPHSSHKEPSSSCQTLAEWPVNLLPQCRHHCSSSRFTQSDPMLCARRRLSFLLNGRVTYFICILQGSG